MDFSLLNATDAAVWFLEKKKKKAQIQKIKEYIFPVNSTV